MLKFFTASILLLFSTHGYAKLFTNSYVSFELPPNWNCKQEGYEHVCINNFSKKQKEAIIILAAKKRGPQDKIEDYENHLKKPRTLKTHTGATFQSKVKAVRKRKINGVDWVDAIQLGSEVQTYYTRYAVTAKDSLGIIVSFSAHKDHYSKYSSDFIKAIQSLRIIAPKDLGDLGVSSSVRSGKRSLFANGLSDHMPEGMYGELDGSRSGASNGILGALGSKGVIGILLLLITIAGAVIYTKSR